MRKQYVFKMSCTSILFFAFLWIACLSVIPGAGIAQAALASGGSWRVVTSVNPPGDDSLTAVAATSANDVWAVGAANQHDPNPVTLIEHWNGKQWSVVASPNPGPGNNKLYGVTAISANDAWAVGYSYNSPVQTLIEHWNGSAWSVITSPSPGTFDNRLQSVAAVSANDVWAVGYYAMSSTTSRVLIEHWNGTQWSVVAGVNPGPATAYNTLRSVTAIAANNIWAVGNYTNAQNGSAVLVERWNGSKWSIVSGANPGTVSDLFGVTAVSASNIWAVGDYENAQTGVLSLIEHWNGKQWSVISSPNPLNGGVLNGVAAVSANNIWAIGESGYPSGGGGGITDNPSTNSQSISTLIEHWNGSNWQIVASPNPVTYYNGLSGVSQVPSASHVWAVGAYTNDTPPVQTLTEFYS